MQPIYNVPIIPQNLRREETVVQTADALKHLNDLSADVFERINRRINENTTRLATISERIEAAQIKISKLHGAKRATQVFSSSKYPADDIHRPYKSIFTKDHNVILSRSKFKFKDVQLQDKPLEPLQFYHVKTDDKEDENVNIDGLGNIPVDVTSVNDLLLCNTGKNLYANYIITDPLQESFRLKKAITTKTSNIGAAPHSLIERATVIKSKTDSYFYLPDLGNVPTIDVPLDLPDLPGVADDLRYINQVDTGIAPSVTTTPIVPDLPQIIQDDFVVDATPELPPVPLAISVIIPDLQDVPRKDIKPDIEHLEHVDIHKPELQLNTTNTLPNINNAHASLMEAIRKAGGSSNSKLKSTDSNNKSTGDLMTDLRSKISLRRKGISGLKNPDPNSTPGNLDSSTTMQKISAMIPPPPTKIEQSDSTNTEDEDWDD